MDQFNINVQCYINKHFNISYNCSIKSVSNTGNILSKYYGRMIICIFLNKYNNKFIATFGDFKTGIHFNNYTDTKIIKNIKQLKIPYIQYYCCGLYSCTYYKYELHITCNDDNIIILKSDMLFKIFDNIHEDNPTEETDLDHNY